MPTLSRPKIRNVIDCEALAPRNAKAKPLIPVAHKRSSQNEILSIPVCAVIYGSRVQDCQVILLRSKTHGVKQLLSRIVNRLTFTYHCVLLQSRSRKPQDCSTPQWIAWRTTLNLRPSTQRVRRAKNLSRGATSTGWSSGLLGRPLENPLQNRSENQVALISPIVAERVLVTIIDAMPSQKSRVLRCTLCSTESLGLSRTD